LLEDIVAILTLAGEKNALDDGSSKLLKKTARDGKIWGGRMHEVEQVPFGDSGERGLERLWHEAFSQMMTAGPRERTRMRKREGLTMAAMAAVVIGESSVLADGLAVLLLLLMLLLMLLHGGLQLHAAALFLRFRLLLCSVNIGAG
jgi:hypothetical protein